MEIFRLTPEEENIMTRDDSDDEEQLMEWERMEKILKGRGIEFTGDIMQDLRYSYLVCEDFSIYESDSDEPVYVIE